MRTKVCLAISFLTISAALYGQTSGPSTPDVQKFTPSSSKNLVNLFTGDFNYNITLLELDGNYPINLSYASGVKMMEEAGPVGLGWQLNIGRINRTVRGVPDDFKGDQVIRRLFQADELTVDIGAGFDSEFFGYEIARLGLRGGATFSNKAGHRGTLDLSASLTPSAGGASLTGALTLGLSNTEGASITPNIGLRYGDFSAGLSAKYNFSEGMRAMDLSAGLSVIQPSFPLLMARTPFTPAIEFSTRTSSVSLKFRGGGELWGLSGGAFIEGMYSRQSLVSNQKKLGGFGFMYLEEAPSSGAMTDIGSEKDGPVFAEDPALPIHYLANDVFDVSAQGISGVFRPFRTDIGATHNENRTENYTGASLGGETHPGAYVHAGLDVTPNMVSVYTGEWRNSAAQNLKFSGAWNDPHVYFKNMGEVNSFGSEKIFNMLKGVNPLSFDIGESTMSSNSDIKNAAAERKAELSNTSFTYLTALEAAQANKLIRSYKPGTSGDFDKIPLIDASPNGNRKEHHIAVITVTRDDGMIYEFGIAAYNNTQKEVTFSVRGKDEQDLFQKLTDYDPEDPTGANTKGAGHYFSETTTPAYAYSYLLTAVYSPDYVDITGDGPTPDDLGKYTRFNYTRSWANFKWRTPNSQAMYLPANLSDKDDDMGSYMYGSKEIWTIYSIETKNYIAQFNSSKRPDAFQAADENGSFNHGAVPDTSLYKIDRIDLFKRSAALPLIKSIRFNYSDRLSKGIPASKTVQGKLTLDSVSIKNGQSDKGLQSKYTFGYSAVNLHFDERATDVWGMPKIDASDNLIENTRFPFSQQDTAFANQAARSWQLSKIGLPSGGAIRVDYEAKDYAYVQDKPVMRMFKIKGFSHAANGSVTRELYGGSGNNYVVIDIGKSVSNDSVKAYFKGIKQLYVNCLLDMGKGLDGGRVNKTEEISGYFDINAGSAQISDACEDCITVALSPARNSENPVAWVLWQKIRKSLGQVISEPELKLQGNVLSNVKDAISRTPGTIAEAIEYFNLEKKMKADERGKELADGDSYVRLTIPEGIKLGGGTRVRRVIVNDNWNKMTAGSENSAVYGQEYTYQTKGPDGNLISSGVAAYEPAGNAENPFVISELSSNKPIAADLFYFRTEPYGESFFPAPMVGYSRVVVKDILHPAVKSNTTGFEVYEFYTTRDFPTIVRKTSKQPVLSRPSWISFLGRVAYTASQGFSIELNDRNGKPRSHKVFSGLNSDIPVSGADYRYKATGGKLDNIVNTVDPLTGKVSRRLVGLDYDFSVHTSENMNAIQSPSFHFNLDVFPAVLAIPVPVFTAYPTYSQALVLCKTVTTTKVIYRSGLLESVLTYNNGTTMLTNNRLYDGVTGAVLTTAAEDEHKGLTYTTSIPGYWHNEPMGPASVNAGKIFGSLTDAALNAVRTFGDGDELLLAKTDGTAVKGWLFRNSAGKRSVLDQVGRLFPQNLYYKIKVIRSGRRNQQSLPGMRVVSKDEPLTAGKLTLDETKHIIDASAVTYKDRWQAYYEIFAKTVVDSCLCRRTSAGFEVGVDFNEDGTLRGSRDTLIDGDRLVVTRGNQKFDIRLDRNLDVNNTCGFSIGFSPSLAPIKVPGSCSPSSMAQGTYQINPKCAGPALRKGTFIVEAVDVPLWDCSIERFTIDTQDDGKLNPYLYGILGSWRTSAKFQYVTEREYNENSESRSGQGAYKKFSLLQAFGTGWPAPPVQPAPEWTRTIDYQVYDPNGEVINTMNPLAIPKSQLLGYRYALPVATAENASYYDIASEGFEDWDYMPGDPALGKVIPHFKFTFPVTSKISEAKSHTGRSSMLISNNDQVTLERTVLKDCACPFVQQPYNNPRYEYQTCDFMNLFAPKPAKEYVLSLWLNEVPDLNRLDTSATGINVVFENAAGTVINTVLARAAGPLIDGWQQLSTSFTIPADAAKVKLAFDGTVSRYVDDIRIQPFSSSMKSFVYDPKTLRLMAILDEQNFAYFYEYDVEGALIRVKKETERGIGTIREIRNSKFKQ